DDDRPGEVLYRVDLHVLVDVEVGLDRHVLARHGAAGEELPFVPLEVHQGEAARLTQVHLAVEFVDLAGRAGAVGTAVWQPHPGAQTGIEDRLVLGALDLAADGFDGDRVGGHGVLLGAGRRGRGLGQAATRVPMTSLWPMPSSLSVLSSCGSKGAP